MNNKLLTVFTPTYNREDLLPRGYSALCRQTSHDFCWMIIDDGSKDNTRELVKSWLIADTLELREDGFAGYSKDVDWLHIEYVYKENGGLHTGYNKAIEKMDTEICVCIDSDDYMPDDAVESIVDFWNDKRSDNLSGFIGLDYYDGKNEPIGGFFSDCSKEVHLADIDYRLKHHGDTKMVLRVDLLKRVAPQPSFPGEKNFNPIYMIMLVDRIHPFLLINRNLCFVDYQDTGMAANIYRQYVNSPNSFAALREVALKKPNLPYGRYVIEHLHYIAEKILSKNIVSIYSKDVSWFWVTVLLLPGWLLAQYIKIKAKK